MFKTLATTKTAIELAYLSWRASREAEHVELLARLAAGLHARLALLLALSYHPNTRKLHNEIRRLTIKVRSANRRLRAADRRLRGWHARILVLERRLSR